jgi:hypothetical protein
MLPRGGIESCRRFVFSGNIRPVIPDAVLFLGFACERRERTDNAPYVSAKPTTGQGVKGPQSGLVAGISLFRLAVWKTSLQNRIQMSTAI